MPVDATSLVHGTTVALGPFGVLLRGPSGSGKSDLALRLIDAGARLVADDQTQIERLGERLRARCPPSIAGLLEVRGLGIVRMPAVDVIGLAAVVDLVTPEAIERLPPVGSATLLGVDLPRLCLWAREVSAAAKVRLFVSTNVSNGHAGAEPSSALISRPS